MSELEFVEMGHGADAFEGIVAAVAAGRAEEGVIWVAAVTRPRKGYVACLSTGDAAEDLLGRVSEIVLRWAIESDSTVITFNLAGGAQFRFGPEGPAISDHAELPLPYGLKERIEQELQVRRQSPKPWRRWPS